MKILPKKLKVPVLAILVLVLIFANLLLGKSRQEEPISFLIRPSRGGFSPGDRFFLGIYLEGEGAKNTSAVEIRLIFDKDTLELVSAKKGSFFNQPLIIKWDEEAALFSLAANPAISETSDNSLTSNLSIVELEFQALEKAEKTKVSISPESLIYIRKKGGLYPESLEGYYKIR